MRRRWTGRVGVLCVAAAAAMMPARGAEFSAGILTGYSAGLGVRATGTFSHFAQGFPFAVEIAAGYFTRDAGIPLDARRVFINDNTNGTPTKNGSSWDFRMDFMYKVGLLGMRDAYVYAGPRYSMFTATFDFVGGNEVFNINSTQWGFGAGLKAGFPVSPRVSFILTGGLDYYASASLEGHDTSYSPDGLIVNGRNDYTFTDADQAVNQPKLEPVAMLGISYRL
jgi:hypothetical protein